MKLVQIDRDTFLNPAHIVSIAAPDADHVLPTSVSGIRSTVRALVGDRIWFFNSERTPSDLAADIASAA